MSFLEQDVLGFDVAMDHAVPVRRVEAIRDLARDAHRLVDGQLPVPLQPLAERLARHVGHDVIQPTADLARVEQRQDVGMAELGGELDLAQKAVRPQCLPERGLQHLDRYQAIVLQVTGAVDGCHPAFAYLLFNRVATAQGGGEAVPLVYVHEAPICRPDAGKPAASRDTSCAPTRPGGI